jgi:hypothetical protein
VVVLAQGEAQTSTFTPAVLAEERTLHLPITRPEQVNQGKVIPEAKEAALHGPEVVVVVQELLELLPLQVKVVRVAMDELRQ